MVEDPDGPVVTAIDYDVQFARGGERQWTLFPHLGDTETRLADTLVFTFGRTNHVVTVFAREIAVLARRERQVRLPAPKFEPRSLHAKSEAGQEDPVAVPVPTLEG